MRLSKRLEMVAAFARRPGTAKDAGYRVADVGTDHGYIPIALAQRDPAVTAVAMDIRPGPLKRAEEHIAAYGLGERIETRLGDGVKELKAGEADAVVIAGMGGELIIHILDGGRHLWDSVGRWILSPQSEHGKVRRYLGDQGFTITREDMVREEGQYYAVMEAVQRQPGESRGEPEQPLDPDLVQAGYLYGMRLIEQRNPVLMEFLEREERQLTGIVRELAGQKNVRTAARSEELRQKLSWIKRAMEEMGVGAEHGDLHERRTVR